MPCLALQEYCGRESADEGDVRPIEEAEVNSLGHRYAEYAEFRRTNARKMVDSEHTRADSATRAEKER